MEFKEFKEELRKQISINAKYFEPKENLLLFDFLETINEKDFEIKEQTSKNGDENGI